MSAPAPVTGEVLVADANEPLPVRPTAPMSCVAHGADSPEVVSSLVIVRTPDASAIVALTGAVRLTSTVSFGSTAVSPTIVIGTVVLVLPGAKLAVPFAAV